MEEVKQLALSLGVSDRVRFLGLRTDIPNVLTAADFIVMSSHWEGLSLSNVEGMSAHKPFIASDVNGLREVTKDMVFYSRMKMARLWLMKLIN